MRRPTLHPAQILAVYFDLTPTPGVTSVGGVDSKILDTWLDLPEPDRNELVIAAARELGVLVRR